MEDIGNFIKNFIKTGDNKWFSMIYQKIMPGIYRYYYFKTFDKQLSEDLTSEVFIRVFKNLRKTNLNKRSFMVWIYKIANNIFIDYLRKINPRPENLVDLFDQINLSDIDIYKKDSIFLRKELAFGNPKILAALDNLTILQKDVLIMRFVEDMDYGTIAGIFNKKKSTIRGIIFRAIEKLKRELKQNDR